MLQLCVTTAPVPPSQTLCSKHEEVWEGETCREVKLGYCPVHLNTLDDDVETFPPKPRVYRPCPALGNASAGSATGDVAHRLLVHAGSAGAVWCTVCLRRDGMLQ